MADQETWLFTQEFLRHPRQVGSVLPTSPRLASKLVQWMKLDMARLVVELGPGTGRLTQGILAQLPDSNLSRLWAFEENPAFAEFLDQKMSDPRLSVIQSDAADFDDYLNAWEIDQVDLIVSGIPFSSFAADKSRRLCEKIHRRLRPGGRFVAYQLRDSLETSASPIFGDPLHESWEFLNVPPIKVMVWEKAALGRAANSQ